MKRRGLRTEPPGSVPDPLLASSFDWDSGAVRTLSDRLAESLRDAIIRGDLLPGQPLRQVELSRQLRVSFAPLREALRQLESEGFVRFVAFQGAIVAPLETSELRDFIDILAAIESIAARSAVPAVTPPVLDETERLYQELLGETDIGRSVGLVLRIRLTLYAPSGRSRLIETVRLMRLNSHRWARYAYVSAAGRRLAEEICRGLIDRFRAGDADGAAEFVADTYRAAQMIIEHTALEAVQRAEDVPTGVLTPVSMPPAARRRRAPTRAKGRPVAARSSPRRPRG